MPVARLFLIVILFCSWFVTPALLAQQKSSNSDADDAIKALQSWIESTERPELNQQPWATVTLNPKQVAAAIEMFWDDRTEQLKEDRAQEWEEKKIQIDDLEMKFDYKTFGDPGPNGRRLYISMHGGGGAPARVNEQQWRNQIRLYEPAEGIYLAPRAPTNTWNLWHQKHIDEFFERLIQNAVALEGVDPNRVYILGYSAGGDGVYQLAPRMADRLAAAAMMAGHPNGVSPLSLRNIGFALHMGANDSAYKRNEIAGKWKQRLAELQQADEGGYQHQAMIHEGKGHWMDREDRVAIPWMSEFERDPRPKKIVWHQTGVTYGQFYWLAVQGENRVQGSNVVASVDGQTITIEKADKISSLTLRLDDKLVDLNQPVTVQMDGKELFQGRLTRTIKTLYQTLQERGDQQYMFPAEVDVEVGQ